jgi:hypothetical protein
MCPDWPALLEVAPELQFKHYTLAEAHIPADALVSVDDVSLGDVAICCDLDHNVFNAVHTEPALASALRDTHWFELRDWVTNGPGAAARS